MLNVSELIIPEGQLLYEIAPRKASPLADVSEAVMTVLSHPIGTPPLAELSKGCHDVVIIADDITRPTPQALVLPPLLDALNAAGIPDQHISILIALGTHRRMSEQEIKDRFGPQVTGRAKIFNHAYSDPRFLIRLGATAEGIPITINRRIVDADLVIGCGSIVPHAQVGWGGGAKIVLPGVCGEQTVSAMHVAAARRPDYLRMMGNVDNPIRAEIEEVAQRAGLRFILNVVFNADYAPVAVVAGHPVHAHRHGVKIARKIFARRIPARADIVVIEAEPADIDYWQGLKPLTVATFGVKEKGIIILVGEFPEGISPTHPELAVYGRRTPTEITQLLSSEMLTDGVCAGALIQHALIKQWAEVYCVSPGLDPAQALQLGLRKFPNVNSALEAALDIKGQTATVGVIRKGGDVLPVLEDKRSN